MSLCGNFACFLGGGNLILYTNLMNFASPTVKERSCVPYLWLRCVPSCKLLCSLLCWSWWFLHCRPPRKYSQQLPLLSVFRFYSVTINDMASKQRKVHNQDFQNFNFPPLFLGWLNQEELYVYAWSIYANNHFMQNSGFSNLTRIDQLEDSDVSGTIILNCIHYLHIAHCLNYDTRSSP
jgi:hypothetical protein